MMKLQVQVVAIYWHSETEIHYHVISILTKMAKYGEEKPGNIVNPVSNFNSFSDIPLVIGKPIGKNYNFGKNIEKCLKNICP